ncbi:hypothetical protein GC093_25925 [Paenibacillus sp. LMG 31456]|uniref:Uncharacterized protein n=1 Tax=Paenibacillus foliorum TaxID=2654974 RepID=A0A972H5A4_9BACL|nr:immunoglobulin-like domain-containing protein [Paenibacillus foliorum]NOU96631.1 hypothetical protein [Paenibacillus foliorum]
MQYRKSLVVLSLYLMIISIFAPISAFAVVPSNDDIVLQTAKSALTIGYSSGDSSMSTTSNLTLPTIVNGVTVTWDSSNSTVIDNTGTVNRPAYLIGDATVVLTANLSYGSATPDSKIFVVKVVRIDPTDADLVAEVKGNLQIGYEDGDSEFYVTQNIIINSTGLGSTVDNITWSSDNHAVIPIPIPIPTPTPSTPFTVQIARSAAGNATVVLTATISKGTVLETKTFTLTVIAAVPARTPDQIVADTKTNLQIGYKEGDSSNHITQNIVLDSTGLRSTLDSLTWVIDTPQVISIAGTVTRPDVGQSTVTLTATFSKGGFQDSKVFTLTVIGRDTIPPVSTAALAGTVGPGGWYASGVTVTLNATDATVGDTIVTKYIITDSSGSNSPEIIYSAPFTINGDGHRTITYWSVDSTGNKEIDKTLVLKLDTTAPVSSVNLDGLTADSVIYQNGSVTLTFSSMDTLGSGVADIKYSLNGGPLTAIAQGAPLNITTAGEYNLSYYATDNVGNVETAQTRSFKVLAPIPNVTEAKYSATANSITLNWTNPNFEDFKHIVIRRGDGAEQMVTGNTYTDMNINPSTPYTYKLIVVDVNNVEASGIVVNAGTRPALKAPTGLTAIAGDRQAILSWNSVAGATNYKVYKGTAPGVYDVTPAITLNNGTSFNVTGLSNGTTYYFTVKASNESEDSPYSLEASGTPMNVPIAAPSLIGLALTPSTLSLQTGSSATTVAMATYSDNSTRDVTSNLFWTFSNTGVASISNGVVSAISAGTTVATATYGNQSVQLNITVTGYSSSRRGGSSSTNVTTPMTPTTPEASITPSTPAAPATPTDNGNLLKVISFLKDAIAQAKSNSVNIQLSDISNHWSKDTINLFMKLGVVTGYEDGSFRPNSSITRAEFATIMAKLFNVHSASSTSVLSDINNHWAKQAISALASQGIINGYEDGTFKPDMTITRAEIIAIISRLVDLNGATKGNAGTFTDIAGSWNAAQIKAASNAGIVEGRTASTFAPDASSTKAESLTIILRALDLNPEIKALLDQLK